MIVRIDFRAYTVLSYSTRRVPGAVEYEWSGRVPAEGEQLEADGSDPAMPEQIYYVRKVRWLVGAAGLVKVQLDVEPQDPDAWEVG